MFDDKLREAIPSTFNSTGPPARPSGPKSKNSP